ncbi:bifunctional serine/threonine-protein kinase/ABC transporter substrate-binding protein [Streptomyces sp. NPDC088812]|uniref:bifunctional serine/threonine-protein kinase/ABC transporter substrate-binding protein n=1 Tax=Streptomyces sp. NPDC088812 TaxID=3365905 RepID=UPI0037F5E6CB
MSEPLQASDPSRIAGYRLLRRLGAGGMGVVYLGRTASGTLAAVKVIRAGSGADAAFRARFAREAELARRVDSPWVVPVVDADADAREPWLATAFVPGPSLAEAVAAHGPLPSRAVRVLGGRLAEALRGVHAAGLVHRDVKSGNALLALDGPRLIDFGIARAVDDTALTASGLVVGTPGFLAPEQARGEDATSAGDVFALGCVLAYALTGTPPFGTGSPDALLYRAVHDAPRLDGVDGALRPVIARCLAKRPGDRPTTEEAGRLLTKGTAENTRDTPAVPTAGTPTAPGTSKPTTDTPTDGARAEATPAGHGASTPAGWLPDPVARMVAARSAEGLALPDVEPTAVDEADGQGGQGGQGGPPGSDGPGGPRPGRRRMLLAGGALLLAAGGGAGAVVWASANGGRKPSGSGRVRYVLGVHTTRGGADAALGRVCERAARLAVAEHNASPRRAYGLAVRALDDRGDGSAALEVARRFTADRDVVAVLGPVTEIAMRTASVVYGAAGLTHVSSTTGETNYYASSPRTSFQSRASHTGLGGYSSFHMATTGRVRRLGIVVDRSAGLPVLHQSTLLTILWRDTFDGEVVPRVVAEETDDGPGAVRAVLGAGVDAFVYLGPPAATARAARELAAAGFTGPRWMSHQVYGSDFPRRAGGAGEGWYVVTSAVDAAALAAKSAGDFVRAWRGRYGGAPEPYAAEAYDSVRMLLAEFARTVPADGRTRPARAALAERLERATYEGMGRTYAFGEYHEYANTDEGWLDDTYVHEVRDGRFRQLGSLMELRRASEARG